MKKDNKLKVSGKYQGESDKARSERMAGMNLSTQVEKDDKKYNRKEKHKVKFEGFLESLKGKGQDDLIESIKKGFHAIKDTDDLRTAS